MPSLGLLIGDIVRGTRRWGANIKTFVTVSLPNLRSAIEKGLIMGPKGAVDTFSWCLLRDNNRGSWLNNAVVSLKQALWDCGMNSCLLLVKFFKPI